MLYASHAARDTDTGVLKTERETLSQAMTLILSDKGAVKALRIHTLEGCSCMYILKGGTEA